jgi:hypothetical protein
MKNEIIQLVRQKYSLLTATAIVAAAREDAASILPADCPAATLDATAHTIAMTVAALYVGNSRQESA